MREIIFRGKIKRQNGAWQKGDWVFGPFAHIEDGGVGFAFIYGKGEVFEETVGQYTGRNIGKKKVFDGDILRNSTGIYVVCWDEHFLQWRVTNEKGVSCFNLNAVLTDKKRPCEIVGNIHDNRELLQEQRGEGATDD